MEDLRLNPQLRLCAKFDETSIAKFPVAAPKEMGTVSYTHLTLPTN